MKFVQILVVFFFTATLASPGFADFDLLLKKVIENEYGETPEEAEAPTKAELEALFSKALSETGLSEAELEAVLSKSYSEAEFDAEFTTSLIKNKILLRRHINLPMDPENHCEVAKVLFADKAIRVFYAFKAKEHGVISIPDIDGLKRFLKEALDFATLKSAVCENYY